VLLADDLDETLDAVRNTAKPPHRREKEVRLAPVRRQAREERQQLFGAGNGEGKLLVNLAFAVRLGGGKPLVALCNAGQLAIRVGHLSDLPPIKLPGPRVRRPTR